MASAAIAEPSVVLVTDGPGVIRRWAQGIALAAEWLFGGVALVVGLAVLAALPVVQFLSLGYLLEAGARVARTGRLRAGFIGHRLAARLGGIAFASWLLLWPVRWLSNFAWTAQIIDPGSQAARGWRIATFVAVVVMAIHIATACARGGRLRYFVWPFNCVWFVRRVGRGGYYAQARDAVWDALVALRLPFYFWLGVRGFIVGFAWLAVPVTLLALGNNPGVGHTLLGYLGALIMMIVLMRLPFLQLRMATQNRLAAGFEWRAVRHEFGRAPWAFTLALIVTLAFALPLYLLKIEVIPAEAAWLPSLIFMAFIFPARLMTGWALARTGRRLMPRHWLLRWTARLPMLPATAFYVIVVFFSQYTSWNGLWSLYEQHAFLVPVPFFGK